MTRDKALQLLEKLLNVTEDRGATPNEAAIAASKAQKIMSKYNLEIADLDGEKDDTVYTGGLEYNGGLWEYGLASIVARNFCVKVFAAPDQNRIVFYGFKAHLDVAMKLFFWLRKTGERCCAEKLKELRKNKQSTKGEKNAFYIGYLKGLAEVLDKQCVALALTTPEKVKEAEKEVNKFTNAKTRKARVNGSMETYEDGRTAGRQAATSRALEG